MSNPIHPHSDRFATPLGATIQCAGKTDIGKLRESNQDQFLIADLHKNMHVLDSSLPLSERELFGKEMGKILFVADGMGGANAGEVASELAIQTMAQHLLNSMHWLFHPSQTDIDKFVEDLKLGAKYSHQIVREDASHDPQHWGMGTTLTFAYLIWPMLYVLHVGDSRCYVLRDKSLQLLTKDQTLAQQLHDMGHLDGKAFADSRYHHVLISAIGIDGEPDVLVYKTRLLPGDRVLLCSDGVNAHLEDSDIQEILSADESAASVCQRLVQMANDRGGQDNITALVAITGRKG